MGTTNNTYAAKKGEGIAGYDSVYDTKSGQYGSAAMANGGGGGCAFQAGGGGGANGGNANPLLWNGRGLTNPAYNQAWALEGAWVPLTPSTGGGRGGYKWGRTPNNPLTTAPGNTAWGGDKRSNNGGLGGRPLDYTTGNVYFGGGGGAGEGNSPYKNPGSGGSGGGLVYLLCYGTVSGSGEVLSNGQAGQNAQGAPNTALTVTGNDGSGGGGAGGAIIINSTVSGITINANGGSGGNQVFINGALSGDQNEAEGPGGGGGGGYIAINAGVAVEQVIGGVNGTTNSPLMNKAGQLFPPNGATSGANGLMNQSITNFNITTRDTAICGNGSVSLTATLTGTPLAGTIITWYDSITGGSALGTGANFTTPVLLQTTTYYIGTCPGFFRVPLKVTVSGPFTCSLTPANATCSAGGNVTVTLSGGLPSYTYSWTSGSTAATLTNVAAGNYALTVTDALGCTTTQSTTVGAGPTALNLTNVTPTNNTCFGQALGTIVITPTGGTGPYSYSWSSGSTDSTALSLAANTYSLTVTDHSGCLATTTVVLTSPPQIKIDTASVAASCSTANGQVSVTVSGGLPGFSYSWLPGGGTGQTVTNLSPGSYIVTVTDSKGCTQTQTAMIGGSSGLSVSSTATDATCGLTNGAVKALISGGSGPDYFYSWSNGVTSSTGNLATQISNLASGTYTITVTDAKGCTTTTFATVVQIAVNTPVINSNQTVVCQGDSTILSSSGFNSYNWLPNRGLESVTGSSVIAFPLANVTYTVTATDANSCTSTASIAITVNPSFPVSAGPDKTTVSGTGVTIGGNPTGPVTATYSWAPSSTLSSSTTSNPLASPTQPITIYTVSVVDAAGCIETSTVTVTLDENCTEIFVPTAFSPNSDGENDILFVRGTCIAKLYFAIFNRWGERVFYTENTSNGWGGLFNGKLSDTGVYGYYLKATLNNGQEVDRKGNITLLR